MGANRLAANQSLRVALLVGSCFLLASTGWIAWLYCLMSLAPEVSADVLTLVVGYLMQAMGIGIYALLGKRLASQRLQRVATYSIVAYVILIAPAVTASSLAASLVFGYVANVSYGLCAGHYLHLLASCVPHEQRGKAFGGAYAATTLLTWLLSIPAGGALTRGFFALAVCCMLCVPAALLVVTQPAIGTGSKPTSASSSEPPDRSTLMLACATVLLASMVKNAGFSFPSASLDGGLSLEASRVLYGVGLIAAGYVSDRKRSYGALLCMAALVTPFLMLSLLGMDAPQTLVWSADYLLFGFFSVYRVVLAVDMAQAAGVGYLAGAGLLLGRVGDALGTALCLCLAGVPLVLVGISAVLFALTVAAFFLLYQRIYAPVAEPAPEPVAEPVAVAAAEPVAAPVVEPAAEPVVEPTLIVVAPPDERTVFERFCARHDLSAREREVLQLVLNGRTNMQIATELFVSESTVKFHVRNLLKKTGCKNRLEVADLYTESREG